MKRILIISFLGLTMHGLADEDALIDTSAPFNGPAADSAETSYQFKAKVATPVTPTTAQIGSIPLREGNQDVVNPNANPVAAGSRTAQAVMPNPNPTPLLKE